MGYCAWAGLNEANQIYHDTEWGIPVHDDRQMQGDMPVPPGPQMPLIVVADVVENDFGDVDVRLFLNLRSR